MNRIRPILADRKAGVATQAIAPVFRYNEYMKKVARVFNSFEEAEAADRAYYRDLTPLQRLNILLQLVARHAVNEDGTPNRLERVYRVTKLGER